MSARRYFVTGTDTGVGKTRVTAALARALPRATIVKLVQTGVAPGEPGDAALAAALAGRPARELARFAAALDPWNAALAEHAPPVRAATLRAALAALAGPLVLEGSGGVAVPLNASETLCDVVRDTGCRAIVVVGLRLGCINHANLTLAYLDAARIAVRAVILTATFGPVDDAYAAGVERALRTEARIVMVPYDRDDVAGVARAADALRVLT